MLYLSKSVQSVGSAETGSWMSRPQFNQQTQMNAQGSQGVVNGGLIDFQDNGYRGVNEQIAAAQAFPQAMYSVGGGAGGVSFPPGQAMPATLQGYNHALGAGAGACFTGPPTFLHVNGITYKPVNEGNGFTPVGGGVDAAITNSASVDQRGAGTPLQAGQSPAHQVLTAEELAGIVNERVQTQVDSYLKSQHSHHSKARSHSAGGKNHTAQGGETYSSSAHEQRSVPSQHHHRAVSSEPKALTREEALAVQRVVQANASIKHVVAGGGAKPAAGQRW